MCYSSCGYILNENQFLDIYVIKSARNVLIYSAIIKYNFSFIEKKINRQTYILMVSWTMRKVAVRTNRQDLYVYFVLVQVVLQTGVVVHNHELTCADEPA